jgi:hypothetical protein
MEGVPNQATTFVDPLPLLRHHLRNLPRTRRTP